MSSAESGAAPEITTLALCRPIDFFILFFMKPDTMGMFKRMFSFFCGSLSTILS